MGNKCQDLVWDRQFGNANSKVIVAKLSDCADDEGRRQVIRRRLNGK